jgi:tetratricopeptide (TPR) repeat protein
VPKAQIVVTEDDYVKFRERRRMLFNLLKIEFATSTILYIGYSNQDPNWQTVLSELSEDFFPSTLPKSFRIAPVTDLVDKEILASRGVESIDATLKEFTLAASESLAALAVDFDSIKRLQSKIPPDLVAAFDKNPAAVIRLLSSWTYVNQAPFNETPNTSAFLRGDRANWCLIGSEHFFERDIEEEVYEGLLDYATSDSKKPVVHLILGPAGYGISTLLMILAVRLVKERAGAVFMLRSGRSVIEGDLEFAVSIFPERPFFFVDNAADEAGVLSPVIHRFREMKTRAMIVLGERLNEWRQGHYRITGKEFDLEPLSDPEINRLLDFLGQHSALNQLEHLARDLQFAAIKVNYRKELLVAMRQATEGKSFDAILEDEFRGIKDPVSAKFYLTVCCFFQHGAYVRDSLLSELMGVSLPDLYEKTKDWTEGVVIFDCIDEINGVYAARARHRIIAAVVWERCGEATDRERVLNESLSALNLNYGLDKDAFESFIRSDKVVDSIRTLEGKTRFFDTAASKDPISPYVRQHYARMLSRQNKAELALGQIEEGLRLDPKVQVLHHTKGVILSQLALSTESADIARRRLAQAEDSFRKVLSMNNRDEYSYQGLAQLYAGWAKRSETPQEAAEYISKAEAVIDEGLRVVKVRDGLWIESSKIQSMLGDQPLCLRALENAVRESPGSIIARYLLAKAYRTMKRPQEAVDVLDPVVKSHQDEYRPFIEYSLALVDLQKPYNEAIAVLRLSTLYGLSDPRFIATLGGMLFMNGEFTEADRVFGESLKREFPSAEMHSIEFRPPDPMDSKRLFRLNGKVVAVKAGFAFLECPGYPNFLCPGSKYGGLLMTKGLEVTFGVAFSAKGAVADHPQAKTN